MIMRTVDILLKPEGKIFKVAIVIFLIISFLLRARLLRTRYIDSDELAHMHSAWCVSQGLTPYKDFFEHHAPLLYYLLPPLFSLCSGPEVIFIARGVMLLLTAAIVYLVFRIGLKVFGAAAAWLASFWLAYNFMFLAKTLEIRPDVPAILFFLLGLSALIRARRNQKKVLWVGAGFCFSLSLLFTQKIVFLLAGVVILLIVEVLSERYSIKQIGFLTVGLLLPLGFCWLVFARQGAVGDLFYRTVIMNIHWKRRTSAMLYLNALTYHNPIVIFWSIWGLCRFTVNSFRQHSVIQSASIIIFPVITAGFSLVIMRITSPQYYSLFIPLLVLIAARSLLDLLSWLSNQYGLKKLMASFVIFLPAPMLAYGLVRFDCFWFSKGLEGTWLWLILTVVLFAGFCICFSFQKKGLIDCALILLLLGISLRPLVSMWNYSRPDTPHLPHQSEQLKGIRLVLENTDPEDTVMAGWTGWGFLRPHAYFYHYLHKGILMMLSEEEKNGKVMEALKSNRPKIIIKEGYLDWFSPRVREYIRKNYQFIPEHRLIMMRIEDEK